MRVTIMRRERERDNEGSWEDVNLQAMAEATGPRPDTVGSSDDDHDDDD